LEYAVDDGNITAHISAGKKIEAQSQKIPIYIKTVWGLARFISSNEKVKREAAFVSKLLFLIYIIFCLKKKFLRGVGSLTYRDTQL